MAIPKVLTKPSYTLSIRMPSKRYTSISIRPEVAALYSLVHPQQDLNTEIRLICTDWDEDGNNKGLSQFVSMSLVRSCLEDAEVFDEWINNHENS